MIFERRICNITCHKEKSYIIIKQPAIIWIYITIKDAKRCVSSVRKWFKDSEFLCLFLNEPLQDNIFEQLHQILMIQRDLYCQKFWLHCNSQVL